MKRLLLPALCSALLASHAPAQIDTNSNGLADEWEKAWNNNSLFPPAFNPQADPDGDGWKNLVEALAGTNPFNSQPPTGIIFPEISATPATYEPLPPGETPPPPSVPPQDPFAPGGSSPPGGPAAVLLDPPVVTLTWPTIPGKTYRAHVSENLSTWLPASETFLGSGIHQSYETEPLNSDGTIPAKLFWRVETGDTDSDGDTLTDYEEIRRGLNPFSIDSDGDGIPDNTDPAPLVNSLQPAWDADSTDPAGGNLFASFNFTPNGGATGHVPDISGNTRHGTARVATTPTFHLPSATPPNAEGIAGSGLHCADTRHLAFAVRNPGINFQPVRSLSFWLKTKAADLEGVGQPIFCYASQFALYNQIGNASNPDAIRAYLRKQASGTGYEIVWYDWQNPGAVIRERWILALTKDQLDGNWINLTFVWQGGGGLSQSSHWACYANGTRQTRTQFYFTRFQFTSAFPGTPQDTFLIGAVAAGPNAANNNASVTATFKGSLDRVRLYTAALTPAQVTSIVSQDADNDGLWDSTEMSSSTWKDTNSNGRRDPGEIHYPNGNPLFWQPANTDTDSDGLTDIFEQNTTRTIFHNHDTDGDWSLQISYKDAAGNFISLASPAQTEYLVIDPYNDATKTRSPDPPLLLAPEFPWGSIGQGTAARYDYRERVEAMSVIMLPLSITPDTNRDGKIDLADRGKVTPGKPWRFWTNDDNDSGATGGDDIPLNPGSEDTNGSDHRVNGVRDLVDFFPLDLDLKTALKIFPEGRYRYRLTHSAPQSAPCFRIVQAASLNPADADAYLRNLDTAASVSGLDSLPIHSTGRSLSTTFLRSLEQGNGLLLVEAVRPTTDPIKLQIVRSSDEVVMGETGFSVSITPALDMVRWKYVLPGAADITAGQMPANPPNWPDADRNGKHFVFVHGYNVSDGQSKGWGTEAFKRLFWSGSNARFTAFAWKGSQSQFTVPVLGSITPNYQVNLLHSFRTAKSFKQFLDLLDGEKTVAAHSMGNIVVGSAMHDWGARPKNYIMLNAAAAKECYDASEAGDAAQDALMENFEWRGYPKQLRASEWHNLPSPSVWPADDKRRTLTWRNRLSGVINNGGQTNVYNFYSSGEEVLNNPTLTDPGTNNPVTELWAKSNKTWAVQEKCKGYGLSGFIHTSTYGGWLWNWIPYHVDIHVPASGPWGTHRMRTPAELPSPLTNGWLLKLATRPFFDDSTHHPLFDPASGDGSPGSNYARDNHSTIISEMIPCTTLATGRNALNSALPVNRQIDMNVSMKTDPARWPEADVHDGDVNQTRPWLHSDLRAKAYPHNYLVFDKFVEIGNLNQTN